MCTTDNAGNGEWSCWKRDAVLIDGQRATAVVDEREGCCLELAARAIGCRIAKIQLLIVGRSQGICDRQVSPAKTHTAEGNIDDRIDGIVCFDD